MTANPLMFLPEGLRPSQRSILEDYHGGRMGISAVPGSGKTYTLSMLAARIILSGELDLGQEVLIVTMSNSAVDNFSQRIGGALEKEKMLPGLGYRVRTLHGLAHDIVRENPALLNLANDFAIIDEREAELIFDQAARAWLKNNLPVIDELLDLEIEEGKLKYIRENALPELVQKTARSLVHYAKDRELTPDLLRQRLDGLPRRLPLAEMGCSIYQEYQRSLAYRGAVDFDDLIRLALAALKADPRLVQRLREQWPYILEDEAQDSSRLQEQILRALSGEDGHWVRVGDPNQAIYETFTTADPQHLVRFIHTPGVLGKELPVSGRSTRSIIALANHLIDWTRNSHPNEEVHDALLEPHIRPTGPGDPQPNPPDASGDIILDPQKMTGAEELDHAAAELVKWQRLQNELPEAERETLAVLDLRNDRGAELVKALRGRGVAPVEKLNTTSATRKSAGALTHILKHLANPQSPSLLANAFRVWRRKDRGDEEAEPVSKRAEDRLKHLKTVEDYLYPLPGADWLENANLSNDDPDVYRLLSGFRPVVTRWHGAALLPIDQVLLTLAQDLFDDPVELAITHKLAGLLRQKSNSHPTWRLPELSDELGSIAKNERRFLGFSEDETSFDPNRYRGQVLVTTMHKAKGLEWDRVYLLSLNNYDFPSGSQYDQYRSEKWYLRGRMNLEAEALAQLKLALSNDPYEWYEEGAATLEARQETIRERLRLLYVGITRAKRSLVATWNTGQRGNQQPALPFLELMSFLQKETY